MSVPCCNSIIEFPSMNGNILVYAHWMLHAKLLLPDSTDYVMLHDALHLMPKCGVDGLPDFAIN